MTDWQPIETAPRDKIILLWGAIRRAPPELSLPDAVPVTGYWDEIDGAWCCLTATWTGPFVNARLWAPIDEPNA